MPKHPFLTVWVIKPKFWDHYTIQIIPLLISKSGIRFWLWPLKIGFLAILSKYPLIWNLLTYFNQILIICPTWPPFQIVVQYSFVFQQQIYFTGFKFILKIKTKLQVNKFYYKIHSYLKSFSGMYICRVDMLDRENNDLLAWQV